MSINVPTISGNLKFEVSNLDIDLNTLNEDFNEVYTYDGYGNLITASFKLSRDATIFKFEIDGNIICEVDVSDLADITYTSNRDFHTPIVFDTSDRMLIVKFDNALNFSRNIKFLFKRNSNTAGNNSRVQVQGYAVTITKESRP